MIRFTCLCTFSLIVSPAIAQLSPGPAPQPPRPRRDAKVESTAARQPNSKKPSAQRALLEQKVKQRDQLQTEIDQLRMSIGMSQQILIKIQMLEVNRTKLRKLGVDWASAGDNTLSMTEVNKFTDHLLIDAKKSTASTPTSIGSVEFQIVHAKQRDTIRGLINALLEARVAKILAEPNLVVTRGRPASFHVGGEIPMPPAPGSNKAVDFQKFGTLVDLLAVDLDENKVLIEVRMSVREPDFSREIEIAGTRVPSMSVRQFDTAMEIPSQHTAILAGLCQERLSAIKTDEGIESETEEVELLFLVTPEILQPPLAAAGSE